MNPKKCLVLPYIALGLILLSSIITAPPPGPRIINGTVYNKDGSYATGGIPLTLNNTNNSDFVRTTTNGTGPDYLDASYSSVINGADNDTLIIIAWNSTYYGTNATDNLSSETTFLNAILSTVRPSETNVTTTSPANDTVFNITGYFNLTAEIAIIGGQDGTGCSADIALSDNDVLKLAPGETSTKSLGDISLGSSTTTSWNITGNLTGNSNITVHASCTSDGLNFDSLDSYTSSNITIQDIDSPEIKLEYPHNNSKRTISNDPVIFRYNVSDSSDIANCSLIINGKINKTNQTITKEASQSFGVVLPNSTYNWSVNCTDNSTSLNTGSSYSFNLTIIPERAPSITNILIDNPIDLEIGLARAVYCNATVNDENNISGIIKINSTLYHHSSEAIADDDNNNHYTNSTCRNISIGEYGINISCSFDIYYYADNGSWTCNISAFDDSGLSGSGNKTTTVNDLLAVEVSPGIIDYGELEPGQVSLQDFKVNITNLGNINFNITVDGYGIGNGDGLAMGCEEGSISLMYEKYANIEGKSYDDMANLTDSPVQVGNMTLPQRTNDTTYKNDRNHTYWKIGVPGSTSGSCTGYVTFIAVLT